CVCGEAASGWVNFQKLVTFQVVPARAGELGWLYYSSQSRTFVFMQVGTQGGVFCRGTQM
ncbi:unnamed protein product, partial [Ectocarpus sp. 6 AP-2014]